MIPETGELALWLALPIALWGSMLAFLGAHWGRRDLVISAERSAYAVFALVLLASVGMSAAFLEARFEYWYVANHVSRNLDAASRLTALWAGGGSALLAWALALSLCSAVAAWSGRSQKDAEEAWTGGVLLAVLAFAVATSLFVSPPFERLPFTPTEGRGLHPLLDNRWMAIHLSALYLGAGALAVPFAASVAALLAGRPGGPWVRVARKWVLAGWCLLTLALVSGMRWSYEVTGFGRTWFWDPAESASFLPWLAATAFVHSAVIQERRGVLAAWNLTLACLTFVLGVFAVFLPRAGLLASLRPLAPAPDVAVALLALMAAAVAVTGVLLSWRWPVLRCGAGAGRLLSREGALVLSHLVLVGAAFAVLWGTVFPLVAEAMTGSRVAVGPPFFQRLLVPLALALLALMAVGPALAWRRSSPVRLGRSLGVPLLVGGSAAGLLLALGLSHPWALGALGLGVCALTVVALEHWKGARARARLEGGGRLAALRKAVGGPSRRWSGVLTHVGLVVAFMGLAGAAFDTEVRQALMPGESLVVPSGVGQPYTLTYEGLSVQPAPNMWRWIALFRVGKGRRSLGMVTTEERFHEIPPEPSRRVGIRSLPHQDLYVVLAGLDEAVGVGADPETQGATFQVLVKPLVSLVWVGGLMMVLGGLMALGPGGARPAGLADGGAS